MFVTIFEELKLVQHVDYVELNAKVFHINNAISFSLEEGIFYFVGNFFSIRANAIIVDHPNGTFIPVNDLIGALPLLV